jgi:signal transduction histidine kinase
MRANADPVLLRTLLENLVGNAWKYTSKVEGARIDIFMEEQADGARAFVVRDNGAGFDPRYAERLFGPFVRLHSQSEFTGTGVGLATAKRIVSRHGGQIWAESTPGEGATFRFTLG